MDLEAHESIEVALVLEGIRLRYGFDFRNYAPASMCRRVLSAKAKSGAKHLGEFLHWILEDPATFQFVLPSLTVQVTEMFRDPPLYLTFRREVVPILRTYPHAKIWHAGCASGEEAYSTAIVLFEEGLYERAQIYGTDLDEAAVRRAKEGLYSDAQAEAFAENYESAGGRACFYSHFVRAYSHVSVVDHLRRHLVFFQHNLVSDHSLGQMHAIFCRNVMLYFDATLRERVFRMFVESLHPGGFLFLGASECVPEAWRASFEPISRGRGVYRYRGRS